MRSVYEIVIAGEPGPTLLAALPDFEAVGGAEQSVHLVGPVEDQAALQGVLHLLHELHVELIEVRRIEADHQR